MEKETFLNLINQSMQESAQPICIDCIVKFRRALGAVSD